MLLYVDHVSDGIILGTIAISFYNKLSITLSADVSHNTVYDILVVTGLWAVFKF